MVASPLFMLSFGIGEKPWRDRRCELERLKDMSIASKPRARCEVCCFYVDQRFSYQAVAETMTAGQERVVCLGDLSDLRR